jgi:hypothetical protein
VGEENTDLVAVEELNSGGESGVAKGGAVVNLGGYPFLLGIALPTAMWKGSRDGSDN